MDKRYEPIKEYGRVNKKPKLEIVVNKGRPNHTASVAETSRNAAKPKSTLKPSPDDFWDDDDDEVILLASQVVEREIPRGQTMSSSIQTMDFTFSEFAPNAKVTSTQKPFAPDVELFSELLDDDWGMDNVAEPVFKVPSMVPLKRVHQEIERCSNERESTDRPFSDLPKSTTPPLSQPTPNGDMQSAPISLTQPGPSNKLTNREKAHECQIQFLQKRADTLKKENTKITKELEEFKNKMESKDGEVSLLRDEIRHLKQQIQNAHREKLHSTDVAKSEWQDKINELAKQVEAQQTVLEFKTMEISKLKMNHADETMRFEHSMRENLNETMPHQRNVKVTSPKRRRMNQLQNSARLNMKIPTTCSIPIEMFDHSTEKGNSKFRKDVFQREMERLQFHMSRLQYVSQLKSDQRSELAISVINSAKSVIAEFWTYVHSLEYNQHCQNLPYHAYDIAKDSRSGTNRWSPFQAEVLFPSEKAINLRRYIAGLSIICRLVPETSTLLFTIRHNEYLLIEIVVDALNKLGFSHEICQHFGVVESFALLLTTLWENHIADEKYQEHLISLLKTLVFCRPNPWTNKYITQCLEKVSKAARAQLCCNSRPHAFSVSQSVYKFTPDSCILQVYAGLLEIAFPAHQELTASQFTLLCEICDSHLNFFTNCFPDPAPFVADILPYDDDLDEDGMLSQRPGVSITCQCYIMMCSSVVKLLYQVLGQWQQMERQHELKLIEKISKVGVRLLHTIFIRYYMTKLFDHKGYLTRHYLYFVCKYWLESMESLRFTETHREALDQLASSHIIEINTSPEEPNTLKVDRDLAKWYSQSGDTRPEGTRSTNVNSRLKDVAQLRILEKTCKTDGFFKRY